MKVTRDVEELGAGVESVDGVSGVVVRPDDPAHPDYVAEAGE